jgi:serine protease AprX
MKKGFYIVLFLAVLVSFGGMRQAAQAYAIPEVMLTLPPAAHRLDPALDAQLKALQPGEMTTVIVTLRQRADLSRVSGEDRQARLRGVVRALQAASNATQGRIKGLLNTRRLQGRVKKYVSLWVINGFSVTATSDVIHELAQDADVYSISPDDLAIVPALAPAEPNITLVNAPALWSQGYIGQGVVVANMDSGVDLSHPDLAGRWRGGTNSWYDPYNQHPATPTDLSGHGTGTMGIMVGGDAGGTTIGVAPGAQWVAVKIFDDQGRSTATAIHSGFQWLLDPDGNPATPDAPQVVNNSWSFANPGCYLDFEPDLQALRSAGMLPVFAAGNGGPYSSSSYSPANNPSAFSVGAIDNNSKIYAYSSRGPSTCGGSTSVFPKLVAPGVNIKTTDLYGGYYRSSGTSFAAPHVAGALALLLSAYPGLTVAEQESGLLDSAVDLGAVGPDNVYGYGRLDILAAFNRFGSISTATPIPAATATAASTATATLVPPPTDTPTPLPGAADTDTPTPSSTPLLTDTATPLPAVTDTPTPTPLPTDTATPLPTATDMPTLAPSPTLPPTATATPLPTATPTAALPASPTPTLAASVHIGDLDRSVTLFSKSWNATVTILVHNSAEAPVAGVTVYGKWTNGATGTASCVTNASGLCSLTKSGLRNTTSSVTFTVTNVAGSGLTYNSATNHDPDGDSNGTAIVIRRI